MIDDTKQGSMDLGKISIEPNTDEPFEMVIEVTKDYTFSVSNNSNKSTSFRVFITLEDAKSKPASSVDTTLPNTERIKFPAGSIEVNLEKSVLANNAKRFVFWAKAGQEISFTVTPKRKNSGLSVDFNNDEVEIGESFSVIAPKTGDFMIQVLNASNVNQGFTLDLGIAEPQADENIEYSGNETRVQFAKNESDKAITKDITANGSVDFLINLKKDKH